MRWGALLSQPSTLNPQPSTLSYPSCAAPLPGGKRKSLYGTKALIINDRKAIKQYFCQGMPRPLGRNIQLQSTDFRYVVPFCRIASALLEQIIQSDLFLYNPTMLSIGYSISRNHCQMYRLLD